MPGAELTPKQAFVTAESTMCIDRGHLPRHFALVDFVICVLLVQSGELLAAGEFAI